MEAVRKAVAEDPIFVSPDLLREYREVPAVLAKRGKIENRQFMALIAGIAAVVANARPGSSEKVARNTGRNRALLAGR